MCVSAESSCSDAFDLQHGSGQICCAACGRTCGLPYGDYACEELDHLLCVTTLAIEEIETVADLLYGDSVLLGAMFENELLEEEKGSLVGNFLSDLDESFPGVLCCELCTVGALTMLDEVLNLEDLFKDGRGEDLLLDGKGDTEAFGVGFCPDEMGLCEADLVEALELLEADGEELLRLGTGDGPA